MLSEILTDEPRRFSYPHFSEVLSAVLAEGIVTVRAVAASFTLLKPVKDVPKRPIRFSGFRMLVCTHIVVNDSSAHSVLFLLPLAST